MARPAILKIDIIADASAATRSLGKLGDAAEKSGSKWKSFAKGAAVAGGAAALGGVIALFKTGIGEQKDFLAGQAQLANGIKTTGNAAHVSVKGLEDLAGSVQAYSGQTDDSIVSAEKLLLTFTGISNAAGKNNDIFNQATKMTADMAAKMGGDASKYAVQLGKALNDPVKGITALTRVGVTFTAAQKKQITQMQKSGDTIGAQKVIMAELRKEFGGSAKAAGDALPGQMEKAKRSFEDISQGVIAGLMPVLVTLSGILVKNVLPAFSAVMGFITAHQTTFGILAGVILTIVGVVKAWSIAQAILNSTLLANPIFLIVAALAAIGVGLVIAYKKSETFRNIVNGAFRAVKTVVNTVANFITKTVPAALRTVLGYVKKWGPLALAAFLPFIGIPLLIWQHWSQIKNLIGRALSGVGSAIVAPFSAAWAWLKQHVISPMSNMFDNVVTVIGRALSGVEHAITAPFSAAWDWIQSHVIQPLKNVWNGIADAINAVHFTWSAKKIGPVTVFPGGSIDPFPTVPHLATGGVFSRATSVVVGEAGREIVSPEALMRKLIAEGGGTVININGALDPDAVARQIEKILTARARRVGGVQRRGVAVTP